MKKRTYFAVVAERALSRGEPLARALSTAAKAGAAPSSGVNTAIAAAGSNRLPQALTSIAIDPLVAAIAQLEPAVTARVGQRLRRLPTQLDLLSEHLLPAMWPVVVSFIAINIVLRTTVGYVFPVLQQMYRDTGDSLPGPTQFMLDLSPSLPGLGTLILLGVVLILFRRRLLGGRLQELRTARLCVAASALLEHGQRPEQFLPRLFAVEGASKGLRQQFENLPLELKPLDQLSEAMVEAARHRVIRWGQAFRFTGYTLNFTLAVGLAGAIYLAIAQGPFTVAP